MEFEKFSTTHFEKLDKGLALFNEQKYWECHEELEHWWLEDQGDSCRYVYWAVIQVAAALIHYRDKNLLGATNLILKAKDKIKILEERKVESDLLFKETNWLEFKKLTKDVPINPRLEDFSLLFDFRFKR